MLIDVAQIKKAIKPKADSTLYNMKKADLIEYIRCLENNYNAAVWFNENQAQYIEKNRFMVLPCKVGDTLFFILDGKIYRAVVRFLRWEQHKERGVRSDVTANVTPHSSVGASFDDFGKTVFFTLEEAEAALKGGTP